MNMRPIFPLGIVACLLLLIGCVKDPPMVAGGWSDTETGQKVAGLIRRENGQPAAGALIQLRPDDYLSRDPTKADSIGLSRAGGSILDGMCDSTGHFLFDSVNAGKYSLEARDKEINAVLVKFEMKTGKGRLDLPDATVKPVGSITGRVIFSDGVPGPVLVRIYGLERAVLADVATGVYTFGNIPEGTYTLQFKSLEPFVPTMEKAGIHFTAGSGANAGETTMLRGLKQGYAIREGFLDIQGVDSASPVIFENGAFYRAVDGAYLWAKASMGQLDLRGTIVGYAKDTGEAALQINVANCAHLVDLARKSGMHSIADPVAGARRKLVRPASGNLFDIAPDANPGSLLLIKEARKASPSRPLILICGTNLTTAANALLIDPSIADRMVVFGVNNGNYNDADSLAIAVVARKARFVEWSRNYVWDFSWSPTISPGMIPRNRFGELLYNQLSAVSPLPSKGFSIYGDFGAATFLYQRKVWRTADAVDYAGAPLNAVISVSPPFDFLDIPDAANDWNAIEGEFYATVANPAAYHPCPWVTGVNAAAYWGSSGIVVDSNVTEHAEVTHWSGNGAWVEYRIQVDSTADYALDIRYQSDTASRLQISDSPAGAPVMVDLPAMPGWSVASAVLPLSAGTHILRVENLQGRFSLEWIRPK